MSAPWHDILRFWFEDAAGDARGIDERVALWFGNDAARRAQFDDEIRARFGDTIDAAVRGELDDWARDARGRLALILVLDQFPRNVHRGSGRAFSGDERALRLAIEGMANGADHLLDALERMFFYMPLQHAEDAAVQRQSVEIYRRLVQRLSADVPEEVRELIVGVIGYAEMHRDIVVRFGRFPHRNALLGRRSTPAEREYLAGGAADFGQAAAPAGSDDPANR